MAVRRKVFRIEEMMLGETPDLMPVANTEFAMCQHETLRELKALRAMVERRAAPPASEHPDAQEVQRLKSEIHRLYETVKHTKQEVAALHAAGFQGGRLTRVANELGAVLGGAESATHRILTAAETIDANANTLADELKSEQQRNLTQGIQDDVVRIFEACVFHDLTGQRIAKVSVALKAIEDHVSRMIELWGGPEAFKEFMPATNGHEAGSKLLNGPRLGDEIDHVNQNEIDSIFASFRPT
jgi:chemotaxis protein CheZ